MTRPGSSRWLAYAVSLPLMGLGSLSAHSLAYRAIATDREGRVELLEHSGHGYLACTHLAVALCVTFALVGLVCVVVRARNGWRCRPVPVWPFALVLSVGFAVQEHVERVIATGALPVDVLLEPTFVVGLLLQLVVAIVAALIARALLATGELIARVLTRRWSRRAVDSLSRSTRASSDSLAPISVLALGHGQRAPPLFLALG